MELGEKILRARQELGISQRQLCGDVITRNMLSRIEHGAARPSMNTLAYLARQLGKPVSYFLDDEAEPVPAARMTGALTLLQKAEKAVAQQRYPYARELLEELDTPDPELLRRKLLLLGRIPGADLQAVCAALPSLDEELLLRARAALDAGDAPRGLRLLEAAEDRESPHRHMLMGRALLLQRQYENASAHFHRAEDAFPRETAAYLEQCYRELGDYRRAYEYACRQKNT